MQQQPYRNTQRNISKQRDITGIYKFRTLSYSRVSQFIISIYHVRAVNAVNTVLDTTGDGDINTVLTKTEN